MADGVARSPSQFCSRDEDLLQWRRLEYDFVASLLLCLASYIPFFVFLFFLFIFFSCIPVCLSSCSFVCAASICYSQQIRILWYVFFLLLVSFVPYPVSEFLFFNSILVFFFRASCLSGAVFCCCTFVPGTLSLDLPTLLNL